MKGLAIALSVLALTGAALADGPEISYGTAADSPIMHQRPDVCQWGFADESIGWGYSLYYSQQLGIECFGPFCITAVGFYVEFGGPGMLDIVIYDAGVEVSRTPVMANNGNNDFDITDVQITGTACIMLCPTTLNGVCGEDFSSPPYHSFWSQTCQCSNLLSDCNEFIWVTTDDSSPADPQTWGSIKTLFW